MLTSITIGSIGLYVFICIGKTIEVSLAILRTLMITKGQRVIGACIGFFEVIIWVLLVNSVLSNITSDPFKVVAYAMGFSLGNIMGSLLEEKIGLGNVTLTIIVEKERGRVLLASLQAHNIAVTAADGEGLESSKMILMTVVKRRNAKTVINTIKEQEESAFITIADTKPVYGGYGLRK